MARPPKLTPELLGQVEELESRGGTAKTIAQRLSVSPRTVTRARALLRELEPAPEREPMVEAGPLALADLQLEQALVSAVVRAAELDWRAGAWLLERRFPQRWGRPSDRTVVVTAPAPVVDDPFAEIDELAAKRRRRWASLDD